MHRLKRALLCAAVAASGSVVAVAGIAQPAQAMNYTSATLAAWTWTNSADPGTAAVNPTGDAPIGTVVGGTHRAYFTYDLTPFHTQALHGANLYSYERSVEDCGRTAPIEIWRTGAVTSTTTWKHTPKEQELIGSYQLGKGVICPGAYVGVDVLSQITAAIARHDKTITFEARVAAGAESDPGLGRVMRKFALSVQSNTVPKVSAPKLLDPDRPCGTVEKHPSAGGDGVRFGATLTDPDPGTYPQATYAIWPVDHPDQRVEGGPVRDLHAYPDGTLLAWAAQAADRDDTSPWSKTCYLSVDNTAPATVAVIHSKQYAMADYPGSGGPGVAGTFVVDAAGNQDIVGYDYDFGSGGIQRAKLGRPGGSAKISMTPTTWGPARLRVRPVDAAGNRGEFQTYSFYVRNSAPYATVTVGGVGLPSTIKLGSVAADATAFEFAVDGGAVTRVPVAGGDATAEVIFTSRGTHTLTMRAYDGKKLVGAATQDVPVSDAPKVDSAEFRWDLSPILGVSGSFAFTPKSVGVVAYRYDFGDGEEKTIEAAADGKAVLPWTASRAGYLTLTVRSVTADGVVSDPATSQFHVIDTHPSVRVSSEGLPDHDGVGLPVQVELLSELPGVTGFVYSYDGGPDQTVDEGFFCFVEVVASRAGDSSFTARAKLADGTLSPATTIAIHTTDAPVATVHGPFGPSPVAGMPATVTLAPGMPGVVEYRYHWGWDGEETTLPAGPDGKATLTWTPDAPTWLTLSVTSVTADGTVSSAREISMSVDDPAAWISATWDDWYPTGGMGVPGTFLFSSNIPVEFVAGYRWHVDDDAVQTVDASPDSWTYVPFTPAHPGAATLYVQQEFTDGTLSPVQAYPFVVGTEPQVEAHVLGESGKVGEPEVFRFSGGMPGLTSFDYRIEGGGQVEAGTVTADSAGVAQVTFTAAAAGQFGITVVGHTADGTASDDATRWFSIDD